MSNQAAHARRGAFEPIAWDASNLDDFVIMPTYGWELDIGPKLHTQIATGAAGSFQVGLLRSRSKPKGPSGVQAIVCAHETSGCGPIP
jgi:hypothetical protein